MCKSFLASFVSFLVCFTATAQSEHCGTLPTPAERARYAAELDLVKAMPQQRSTYEDNTIKVVMYRIRETDGSGGRSDGEFAEEINNLNSYFTAHDICFSLMRIDNIDNSAYTNEDDWDSIDEADSMTSVIVNAYPWFTDVLTIYVLPPTCWYGGSALGIPSTGLFMTSSTNGKWGTAHIAHEVSHCLGNFHTHDDSGGAHLELVDRFCPLGPFFNDQGAWFDCCAGADGLCSTQADPNIGDTTSYGEPRIDAATCTYEDTTWTDFFGNFFTPDVSNIMSYAPISCRNSFSWEQVNRFHLTLDLNLDFSNLQVPANYSFGDALYSSGYANLMAKDSIVIAPGNEYRVEGSAQILHEAEIYIDLRPGFVAAPTATSGIFRARAKDLCQNDTTLTYVLNPY